MKLLLDTHIWLWSTGDPGRLSHRVQTALREKGNELWLSSVSIWEVTLLAAKGRIKLNEDVTPWVHRALAAAPVHEAPLTHEIVLETTKFHLPHRDPADYFLGATARVLDLILVTADERLIRARQFPVLANR
jgi:PIN domain nuclease of toxin-antitoxin system